MNKKKIYADLMTGVSYFLPFVVGGGILTALAFIIDVGNADTATFGATTQVSAWFLQIGGIAMGLMLPILAGYIAFSIGDRPALLLGIVSGTLAADGGSGFLGAIVAGFASGYLIEFMKKAFKGLPRSLEGIKTLLLYPILGLLAISIVMIGVNGIVTPINNGLTNFLTNMSGANSILLGAILGAMLAIDLGGPINKTAYLFAVSTLTTAAGDPVASVVMAAVGSSAMVVSTSCAVATTLFPKKFSPQLRAAKTSAYIMGLAFFVEGAIPYVIAKPKQILPSLVVGAAVTGAITAGLGITLAAPIGGIETLPLVSNIPLYLLSFVIGTAVAVGMIWFLTRNDEEYELD